MSDDYLTLPGEHFSVLKEILVSPHAYRHAKRYGKPDKDALRVGRAAHAATLEPSKFATDYVCWPERRQGKEWEAFKAAALAEGKTVLTLAQHEAASTIADAVRANPIAAALLATGEPELALQWRSSRTGIACKGRLDWLAPTAAVELKAWRDVSPRAFGQAAASRRLPFQMSFYSGGLFAARRWSRARPWKVIAAQNQAPWDVVVYDVSEEVLAIGDKDVDAALTLLETCQATDRWPGIANGGELPLTLPAWLVPQEEPITFGDAPMFGAAT